MAFTSGQWGPDTFIDSAGNTVLIGATVTATGYVCTVDSLGNLTVTGPAVDSLVVTVTPATGAVYTATVQVKPLVAEIESKDAAVQAAAIAAAAADATAKADAAKAAAEATAAAALAAQAASDRATYSAKGARAAIEVSPVPGLTDARYYYNFSQTAHETVVTVGDVQYAIWVNDASKQIIGKRTLPNGKWSTFDLSTLAGAPLGVQGADLHNSYSLGVDSAGRIHVSGNMHGDNLRYIRSTNPGDITAWSAGLTMVGTEETLVSYPKFFTAAGVLLFLYRTGASGAGDWYLNRFDAAAQTWSRVCKLFDGLSLTPQGSAYTGKVYVDKNGTIHMFFMWAPFAASHDMSYIRSADGGVTWTDVAGGALTLPIVPGQAVAFPAVPGLTNACPAYVDVNGYPHTVNLETFGANRQIVHYWHNGASWARETLTGLVESGTSSSGQPGVPMIFGDSRGQVFVTYSAPKDGKRGGYYLIPCSSPYRESVLLALDIRDSEFTYDMAEMRDNGRLVFLAGPSSIDIVGARPEYWKDDNWHLWAGVVTVDVEQIDKVLAAEARLPTIRSLGTVACPQNTAVTATTQVVVPGSGSIMTPPELRGQVVMVRALVRASVSAAGTTLTMQIQERQQGGSARNFGTLEFTGTSSATKMTQWMPLRYGPIIGGDSELFLTGKVAGGGTATVISGALQYGVLAGPGAAPLA